VAGKLMTARDSLTLQNYLFPHNGLDDCHLFFAFSSMRVIMAIKIPIGRIKNATKIFSYEMGWNIGTSSQGCNAFDSNCKYKYFV